MNKKCQIQYPAKINLSKKYDKTGFILDPLKEDLYVGRSLISDKLSKRKNPAMLFFAREDTNNLYLLQLNPTGDTTNMPHFFTFLHIFNQNHENNLFGNSYNYLSPNPTIKTITNQFKMRSVRPVLENILTTITPQMVEEVLSDSNIKQIVERKGTYWSSSTKLSLDTK